jgi:tRNA threonylcarbamoyladenosine dehydratase
MEKDKFQRIQIKEFDHNLNFFHENEIAVKDLRFIMLDELASIYEKSNYHQASSEIKNLIGNEKYGVLVYYPWLDSAFLIPEKNEFISLRTARNRNKIFTEEQKSFQDRIVGIVGLSVGFSVLKGIVMERLCDRIRIADFDELSTSNLNRLPFGIKDIGVSKTELARRWILEIDPFMEIEVFEEGINENNVDDFFGVDFPLDVIVDECDSGLVKLLLRVKCRATNTPLVMETSDRGLLDIEDYRFVKQIFHGLISDAEINELMNISDRELLMRFIDISQASQRGKDSLSQIGVSLDTWPQLAGDVLLGGATATIAIRKIFLGDSISSGRYFFDVSSALENEH